MEIEKCKTMSGMAKAQEGKKFDFEFFILQ
jgi:hypothetical protein